MSHFAVIAPPFAGHFWALEALAECLIMRGHRVTFVQQEDARALLRQPQVEFAALGQASHPPGSLATVIAHAGLNTVLDALVAGTPMLALPIAFDQPAIAARVVYAGAGLRASPLLARRSTLRRLLRRLLDEPAFAEHAPRIGAEARQAGGAERAADIVEAVLKSGRPVLHAAA
ncbi:nucleotide disphospho-sugar-binding domain-containing protein [Azotobacter chroococcum]|uniref:nucleotide disphospho-sugar-binding domain-containing protein n=1 Tax=Azotobacter chroococcum TaxID=353 RepID=UPI000584CF40|nr:nucleotide disphospho-sugar-binding domain-containing protein [Azotobacter chroococcum]